MGELLSYLTEVQDAMKMLSDDPRTIFVGQAVEYDGQAMHKTLIHVPMSKRLEMPVVEEFQAGFCIGLALEGYIPICIYPRFDFLICATNQIVNHLDKIPLMTEFRPKVILRTSVGSVKPLDPGPQHRQDHTQAFKLMCQSIKITDLWNHMNIQQEYETALNSSHSHLMIERGSLYA